jgi:hypothetical protein
VWQLVAGSDTPPDGAFEMRRQAELLSGQTLVLAGPRRADDPGSDTAVLLLITAEGRTSRPDRAASANVD